MRRICMISSLMFLALIMMTVSLQAKEGPYMLVRVDLGGISNIKPIQELGLDIVKVVKGENVEVICFQYEYELLRSMGYPTSILIPDMETFYADRNTDTMGGFLTYTECVTALNQIHNDHPNITTAPFSIGTTIEGRTQWAIKLSDNPNVDENEPEILFDGLTHAREPIGMALCMAILDTLTNSYGINTHLTDLVNTREIFFVPIVNPDGYAYNEQTNPNGGGMWRKNRRLNSGGSYGIDLNRNFGFNWGYNNVGSSPTPSSETYRGTGPFSEPETQNLRQFCNQHVFAIAQNWHSYAELELYSWSVPAAPWGYTPDNATFQTLSQTMAQWTGYQYGTAWEVLYEVNGDANDWMYGEQNEKPKTLAWVFEVGASGFWPPEAEIPSLIATNMPPSIYMIEQAVNYQPQPINLGYVSGVINDPAPGNNNHGMDPGENVTFIPTMRNNGWESATNVAATLICSDPYITVTANYSTYPNLAAHAEGAANTPYAISISSACPLEHSVTFGLVWTCSQGYSDTASVTLLVGDPLYQPMGPDAYGYRAYDQYDQGGLAYSWIEIDPNAGGAGTLIAYTADDQTVQQTLPFTFRYYGADFTQVSICTNGWIAMGSTTSTDYSESAIPNADGPPNMIAPFWEDLSPQLLGRVAYYYNTTQHLYVVEFDSVRQFSPTTARETFQVILRDPAYYPTTTGDGQIIFQYKIVTDPSSCTIGIENAAQTVGLQCWFDGTLDVHMATPAANTAYLFTTPVSGQPTVWDINTSPVNPPVVIPANGGSFPYNINVHNLTVQSQTGSVWNKVRNSAGVYTQVFGPVTRTLPAGANPARVFNQTIAASISSGTLTFISYMGTYPSTVSDSSFFTITKSAVADGGPWISESNGYGNFFDEYATNIATPDNYSLSQNYPNPFNPTTAISYQLSAASLVNLSVYDISGRKVAELVNGMRDAGSHSVTFDASKLASGIYLYKLQAGDFTATQKMVLLK
jgi:hypothetical protein